MGRLLRRFRRVKQPKGHYASTLRPAAIETLRALRDSADAFPPLKSATAGVLHLIELCETVRANRDECQALAQRTKEILFRINDVVPDPTKIPPDLLDRISDFTRSMEPIQKHVETLQGRRFKDKLERFIHHREDQEKIREFKENLDRAFQDFQLTSSITLQLGVFNLDRDITIHGTRLKSVDTNLKHAKTMIRQTHLMLTIFF